MGKIGQEVLITAMTWFIRDWPSVQNFESWQLDAWDDVPYFDYEIKVTALDGNKKVLGVGRKIHRYPPTGEEEVRWKPCD